MSDPAPPIDVRKFRETAAKVIRQQAEPVPKLAKELDKLQEDLDALEKAGTDKAAIAEARKKRDAKRKEIEDCVRDLDVQKTITKPIPKPADPKIDMKKLLDPLPGIVRELIEREGVPLGKHGVLQPYVDFDFKKGQFKEGGARVKWNF